MKWLDTIPRHELDRLLPDPQPPISGSLNFRSKIEQELLDFPSGSVPFSKYYFMADSKIPPEIRELMIAEGTYPALF